MEAIQFTNFSDEDFTWKWDGIAYTFPAGGTMFLENFKAEHFAQHLVDRELDKLGILTNNMNERKKMGKLCFPKVETITPAEALDKNEKAKIKKKDKEPEFAGLKKEPQAKEEKVREEKVKKDNSRTIPERPKKEPQS